MRDDATQLLVEANFGNITIINGIEHELDSCPDNANRRN